MISRTILVLISLYVLIIHDFITNVTGDSWNPVRHRTEEAFFNAKSHERSMTADEMEQKIKVIRDRRHETPWTSTHPFVKVTISNYSSVHHDGSALKKRPNILFMLADDLGFGDLSVPPFKTPFEENKFPCVEGGILTPNLEQLAKEGVRMTNFHSSAPVCSPARTSAMTGLYSWRMTAMNAFELGRDPMQRNGFLPQIPTTAEVFRENGYFTLHSGKWHLGGMREEQRRDRAYSDQCSRPSPNQHGFEEYISELDGPESPRYTFLLSCSCLHTKGHRHLIKDDVPVPIVEPPEVKEFYLSDREAGDAIEYIKRWKETNPDQPWFIQVWFNAPHGPWEVIPAGEELYSQKYGKSHKDWQDMKCYNFRERNKPEPVYQQWWYYKTMVTAMDISIGKIMNAIKELDLEKDTLMVFTSDNGHEMGAGDPGFFKEGKRSLMEGGVRVPAIWKWKGVLPENSYTTYFGGLTDLFPTFLQAAHIPKPSNIPLDGISLLPALMKASPITSLEEVYNFHGRKHIGGDKEIQLRYFPQYQKYYDQLQGENNNNNNNDGKEVKTLAAFLYHEGYHHVDLHETSPLSRVFLWHKDTDPYSRDERMQSAGYYDYVKVMASSPRGCIDRIYDMKIDPTENFNLFVSHGSGGGRHAGPSCSLHFDSPDILQYSSILSILNRDSINKHHCIHNPNTGSTAPKVKKLIDILQAEKVTIKDQDKKSHPITSCEDFYHHYYALKVLIILKKLIPFARTGNYGHMKYMQSDQNKAQCAVPVASNIKTFDFQQVCPNPPPSYGCSMPEY